MSRATKVAKRRRKPDALYPLVKTARGGQVIDTELIGVCEFQPGGFFAPPEQRGGTMMFDPGGYLVEVLRVLGPSTAAQLQVATEMQAGAISAWMLELTNRGEVMIEFAEADSKFVLTGKAGAP